MTQGHQTGLIAPPVGVATTFYVLFTCAYIVLTNPFKNEPKDKNNPNYLYLKKNQAK